MIDPYGAVAPPGRAFMPAWMGAWLYGDRPATGLPGACLYGDCGSCWGYGGPNCPFVRSPGLTFRDTGTGGGVLPPFSSFIGRWGGLRASIPQRTPLPALRWARPSPASTSRDKPSPCPPKKGFSSLSGRFARPFLDSITTSFYRGE